MHRTVSQNCYQFPQCTLWIVRESQSTWREPLRTTLPVPSGRLWVNVISTRLVFICNINALHTAVHVEYRDIHVSTCFYFRQDFSENITHQLPGISYNLMMGWWLLKRSHQSYFVICHHNNYTDWARSAIMHEHMWTYTHIHTTSCSTKILASKCAASNKTSCLKNSHNKRI